MATELNLYDAHFRPSLLSSSQTFYADEGRKNLNSLADNDIVPFLHHVRRRIDECYSFSFSHTEALPDSKDLPKETVLGGPFLDAPTGRALVDAVQTHALGPHVTPLIDAGLSRLLERDDVDEIGRLYRLLLPLPPAAKKKLLEAFGNHVAAATLRALQPGDRTKPNDNTQN
eukprot:CAMPEP_0113313834 /NCGR_PEP_ID=MMETSP0010_2-20120614/10106_1 /TAXON_ID=216773 ORGANISM="Corethron hystrix, Strain 308" /NCGR_SAMPLE_ID=MMETSP0010_2 /ASSEMBLY_ACC=CAM_ASM_000155 /LENGTH=171 /DNA_ID=CAMNT_0000169939 /DNA_START=24 /DNA_END=536 /DNA_ORIENTATION=+ /assembly_acc=CAM_ASM_000155